MYTRHVQGMCKVFLIFEGWVSGANSKERSPIFGYTREFSAVMSPNTSWPVFDYIGTRGRETGFEDGEEWIDGLIGAGV